MNTFKLYPLGDNTQFIIITFSYIIKNNCYHIDFKYDFPSNIDTPQKKIKIAKYFGLYDNDLLDFYQGDIIHKNSMTEQIISYMLLNDDDLQTKSGNVTPDSYRISLIKMIQLLWD